MYYSERQITTNLFKISHLVSSILTPSFFSLSITLWKAVLHECLYQIKNTVTVAIKWHPTEKQTLKNILVHVHPFYSPDMVSHDFCFFPKVKVTVRVKRSELIQVIKATTKGPQKTQKRSWRMASEGDEDNIISVLKASGSILRESNGLVSFTVIF